MKKPNKNIFYGKNVYDKREINAVVKTLKKSTQMGYSVNLFENNLINWRLMWEMMEDITTQTFSGEMSYSLQ